MFCEFKFSFQFLVYTIFSTHAFMVCFQCFRNLQVNSFIDQLLPILATNRQQIVIELYQGNILYLGQFLNSAIHVYVCFVTDCQMGRLLDSKYLGLNVQFLNLCNLANREQKHVQIRCQTLLKIVQVKIQELSSYRKKKEVSVKLDRSRIVFYRI